MKVINTTRLETCGGANASVLESHPRRRRVIGLKRGTPSGIHGNTHNLDKHHETQTICPPATAGTGGFDLIGMGDLGHNDCFCRRIFASRRLGNRQEVSVRNNLDHLFSHNPFANLLLWNIARPDGLSGKPRRSPTSTDRMLASGVGTDSCDGLDHVLYTTCGDFLVSDKNASTVSGVRGWNHLGHHIHAGAGGTVGHFLQTDATADALILNRLVPSISASEATP